MISVSIEKAVRTLPQLIRHTLTDCEETVIVSDAGCVVMIDQTEWEKMRETLRLLSDEKSFRALLRGHEERDRGNRPDCISVGEAFYDL